MHIFIDESGTFLASPGGTGISLVGALTIPGQRLAKIEAKYARIRSRLPTVRGEVKGRLLDEAQVADVVDLLRRNEALLELVAIDMNTHDTNDIELHKLNQARGVTNQLTDKHHPNLRKELEALASRIA